jgi:alpha-glucosidase (family GH31 glycosyl hydrolase)
LYSAKIMRKALAALLLTIPVTTHAQDPEQTTFELAGDQAVVEWISSSTFRFCRSFSGQSCDPADVHGATRVKVTRSENDSQIVLQTEYLKMEIDKQSLQLRVLKVDGELLMAEMGPIARSALGIEVDRAAAAGEKFYGLGARTDKLADARGLVVDSPRPFLISSKGYGLHHSAPGSYLFDIARTKPDRYRITLRASQRFEYYFYYGPAPKAIYEEHLEIVPPHGYARFELLQKRELPSRATLLPAAETPSWTSLEAAIRSLVHASLSGILNPSFDVGAYATGSAALYRRALQFASVVPLVCDSYTAALDGAKGTDQKAEMAWRQRLVPFLLPYVEETNSRGYPIIHPLVLQFPKDEQGRDFTDEFLVGDEILAAPIYSADSRRSVYLPMGRWTDLGTNKEYAGRQTIQIEAGPDEMPLFLRNGSIVPIAGQEAADPMIVHYLPKLGAEFFLYEPAVQEYTQLHAAPVLDLMRLEVNAKVGRSYEWIVHHMPSPSKVTTWDVEQAQVKEQRLLRPGAWYYDAERQNIHICVEVPAGQTAITNLTF